MIYEKIIFKKKLTFRPIRKGGGTFHLKIELGERVQEAIDWNTLEVVKNPLELSMSARCGASSGQCRDFIEKRIGNFSEKDQVLIKELMNIWRKYHLNAFISGTKLQMGALEDFKSQSTDEYKEKYKYLEDNNLLYDRGYKYDSSWLYKEIPGDVIDFIKSL